MNLSNDEASVAGFRHKSEPSTISSKPQSSLYYLRRDITKQRREEEDKKAFNRAEYMRNYMRDYTAKHRKIDKEKIRQGAHDKQELEMIKKNRRFDLNINGINKLLTQEETQALINELIAALTVKETQKNKPYLDYKNMSDDDLLSAYRHGLLR
jgi:superfamily II DNA helicase RecQ